MSGLIEAYQGDDVAILIPAVVGFLVPLHVGNVCVGCLVLVMRKNGY